MGNLGPSAGTVSTALSGSTTTITSSTLTATPSTRPSPRATPNLPERSEPLRGRGRGLTTQPTVSSPTSETLRQDALCRALSHPHLPGCRHPARLPRLASRFINISLVQVAGGGHRFPVRRPAPLEEPQRDAHSTSATTTTTARPVRRRARPGGPCCTDETNKPRSSASSPSSSPATLQATTKMTLAKTSTTRAPSTTSPPVPTPPTLGTAVGDKLARSSRRLRGDRLPSQDLLTLDYVNSQLCRRRGPRL